MKTSAFNATLLSSLSAAFTAAGQLRFEYSIQSNTTSIQGNVDADTDAEFEIQLVGNIALTAADFVL